MIPPTRSTLTSWALSLALLVALSCSGSQDSQPASPEPVGGEPDTPSASGCADLGGTTCGQEHTSWTTGKDGCCFETTAAACESLGCSEDNCDILESAPAQAVCRDAAADCPEVLDCEPPADDPRCSDESFKTRCPNTTIGL